MHVFRASMISQLLITNFWLHRKGACHLNIILRFGMLLTPVEVDQKRQYRWQGSPDST